MDKHKRTRSIHSTSPAYTDKYTREGNMDTRSDTGFGYSMLYQIWSFWIGGVESVKTLKSMLIRLSMITSLTGRPGMSTPSQEGVTVMRDRLGRHLSSNGVKGL